MYGRPVHCHCRASAAPSESAHAFLLKLEAWQQHTQQIVDASAKYAHASSIATHNTAASFPADHLYLQNALTRCSNQGAAGAAECVPDRDGTGVLVCTLPSAPLSACNDLQQVAVPKHTHSAIGQHKSALIKLISDTCSSTKVAVVTVK